MAPQLRIPRGPVWLPRAGSAGRQLGPLSPAAGGGRRAAILIAARAPVRPRPAPARVSPRALAGLIKCPNWFQPAVSMDGRLVRINLRRGRTCRPRDGRGSWPAACVCARATVDSAAPCWQLTQARGGLSARGPALMWPRCLAGVCTSARESGTAPTPCASRGPTCGRKKDINFLARRLATRGPRDPRPDSARSRPARLSSARAELS